MIQKNFQSPASERTSPTLLIALKGRDAGESWLRFINQYEPMLLAWAKKRGLDDTRAREALSDVYVKLVEHLPKFVYDPDQRFRNWLRTILERAIIDMGRRQSKFIVLPNEKIEAHQSFACSPDCELPQAFVDGVERRIALANRIVRAARARVSSQTWRAFYRTEIEEISGADVAHELAISEGAVYTARFRVRAILRQELQKIEPTKYELS